MNYKSSDMLDTLGRFRTASLFVENRRYEDEERDSPKYPPIFSLKNEDQLVDDKLYPSLKKLYMSYSHVPGFEYEFAMDVLFSWDHWMKLTEDAVIRHKIKEWRSELDIKNKAQAIRSLIEVSKVSDPKGVSAAKYLAEKGYVSRKGRPSKEDVERERKIEAGVRDNLDQDMARLGISVIK